MRNSRGFTLIEILVVITIIAALMGLVFVLFKPAEEIKMTTITQSRLQAVAAGLSEMRSPQLLGRYPSADIAQLRGTDGAQVGKSVGKPNDINIGIETVWVLLSLSTHGVTIDVEDDALQNTDNDMMTANPTRSSKTKDLFEYVDAWGNPFVYFAASDYKKAKGVSKYQLAEKNGGEIVEVQPRKSEKTGNYVNPGTFQLFSAGPDMIYGNDDDITNWPK